MLLQEYHKNPSSIGTRSYTQLARWKFREYNELPHLFLQRLHLSYPLAKLYVDQFPKENVKLFARFVAFVSGSFVAVLLLFTIIDPDAFLHFDITPGRTVIFYLGVFTGTLAVARGMVPEDHAVVNPEDLMHEIVEHTHYLPPQWRGKLHSAEVHAEFSRLYPLRVTTFLSEVFSVVTTPLVLWYSLPPCAPAIIDFFREFTIHVDGLGYVCSFAVFDFERHGDSRVRRSSSQAFFLC
jgi:autophagy-related protein 9